MQPNRIISLATPIDALSRRILASQVQSSTVQLKKQTWITLTREGSFTDPRYGRFEITHPMLLSMVDNFKGDVVGIDIFIDVNHEPQKGAAAKIIELAVQGSRLRALVEWTDYGVTAVKEKGFVYLSAEYHENYIDNEEGLAHGPTLIGAGLTVRPVIKKLEPVVLSSASDNKDPIFIHPDMALRLSLEDTENMNKHLVALRKTLEGKNLSANIIEQTISLATQALEGITEDEKQKMLCAQFEAQVLALSEVAPSPTLPAGSDPINKTLANNPLPSADVEATFKRLLAEQQAQTQKQAQQHDENRKLLSETIANAEGLNEETKKTLSEGICGLVTEHMSADEVKTLANKQIELAHKTIASQTLAAMGFAGVGTPHITVPDEGTLKLSQIYRDNLSKTLSANDLTLIEEAKLPIFAKRVLAEFDRLHAPEMHLEHKVLAGEMDTNSATLPVGVQRQVLLESLCDFNILELISVDTDFGSQSVVDIPYEERDISQIVGDGIVYESQPIPFAGVRQKMFEARVLPMKIALSVTNELMHFSRVSLIDWDAWARGIASNARVLRELIARRITNELQRASDAYLAKDIKSETVTPNASFIFKTAEFPVVRPFVPRNLRGEVVGVIKNLIEIKDGSTVVDGFDGSANQSAGTYYRIVSLNQGVFQLVDEKGVPKAASGSVTISYSCATNVAKFDTDLPDGVELGVHLNGLLRLVGNRKAVMDQERFARPNFQFMAATLNDTITNAQEFVSSKKRNGTDTDSTGMLEEVKGIPAYSTNAPGSDLGEDRILMGQKGVGAYRIAKPWSVGAPIEKMVNGQPVAEKVAYGEEYNAIAVPDPIAHQLTSIIVYSKKGRAAL